MKLYLIGLGPGDPELLTLKALRLIQRLPVLFYPKEEGRSPSPWESPGPSSPRASPSSPCPSSPEGTPRRRRGRGGGGPQGPGGPFPLRGRGVPGPRGQPPLRLSPEPPPPPGGGGGGGRSRDQRPPAGGGQPPQAHRPGGGGVRRGDGAWPRGPRGPRPLPERLRLQGQGPGALERAFPDREGWAFLRLGMPGERVLPLGAAKGVARDYWTLVGLWRKGGEG